MIQPILVALLASLLLAGGPPAPEPELVTAARKGDAARVRALIGSGADVNAREGKGLTALMAAGGEGHTEVVRILLRAGADVDAPLPSGWTALMQAASEGRAEAATLLLDAGADIDARDRFAGTALDVAQQANKGDMVLLLRDRGSRGSGRSRGDTVCVRRWAGSGFCGVVEEVEVTRYRVRLTRLEGCEKGCPPDEDCSEARPVGGPGGAGVSDVLWIRSWCLTHTQGSER